MERHEDGGWKFTSLRSSIPADIAIKGQVHRVYAQGHQVTFVTSDRVYRWDGSHVQSWPMPGTRRLTSFRINDELYIDYMRDGLYRLAPSGPVLCVPQADIGTAQRGLILWLEKQPDGWLFATAEGLVQYKDGKSTPIAPVVSKLLNECHVTCGVRLPDGRVAFGTLTSGIVIMARDGSLDQILESDEHVPPYITSLFVDGEGSLWAMSRTGVLRISLDPGTRIFDERANLTPQLYRKIARADGLLTIGNTNGVLALLSDRRHFTDLGPKTTGMHDLTGAQGGVIVSGFGGAWLENQVGTTQIRKTIYDVQTALPSRRIRGETLMSEGTSVIAVRTDGSSREIVRDTPVPVTSMAEDDEGMLWLGTDTRGVFVAKRDPEKPSLPGRVASSLHLPAIVGAATVRVTPSGAILIISDDGAWVKHREQDQFAPIKNYPTRPVAAVSECMDDGTVWVVHAAIGSYAACVARISHNGNAAWQPHSVVGLESIGQPRSIFAEKDATGQTVLWIGGTKAVLRHVVEHGPVAPRPAPPLLRAYMRDHRGALRPVPTSIPYATRAVHFELAEPQYARRALLHLETRISGVDADWVPVGRDSQRDLAAMREGDYTFEARAVAETGAASEPTVFHFDVAPPWWRTPAAAFLALAALAPLAYSIYRFRVRTLQRRNAALEQKVQERTEQLAEASAAKTLFVANMSHDIRNPLNGIVGLTLALEDTPLEQQQREIVATLRECTTYLSSLVDDVLDFASIEAGKIELRPGPFVPAELLNSVVTTLKGETAARGAFITIETDPEIPPRLMGDAGRIQQILVNYVSNALKYAGGHIRLAATMSASSPDEIEFSVIDEGPGLSAEEQAQLFTKFTRSADARRSHTPGTGLGLASCRLLADFMGGAVGVESAVGEGARFFLRLPLAIAIEAEPPSEDVSLPHATVLLVEDTDYNAMAAKAVLAKLGLACERARTGEEAVRLFGEKHHNIVLLDRNLPDMDGNEVARRLRELETDGSRSVLLAVTAYCTADDRALCLQSGMDAFLGKPLTPDKLRKALISVSSRMLGAAPLEARPEAIAETASLDTTLLEYLADGAPGGLSAQTDRFLVALNEAHAGVAAAFARRSLAEVADAAHRVLGHARMIGAIDLAAAAVELEKAARKSDAPAVSAALPQVAREVGALTVTLRRRQGVQKA